MKRVCRDMVLLKGVDAEEWAYMQLRINGGGGGGRQKVMAEYIPSSGLIFFWL